MYFGSSLDTSPEQSAKVGSTSPVALMHGAWSTPMNQMSGLALVAAEGAVDAGVDAAGDVLAPPLLQAATKMDSPANRASPVLRMRMCPPQGPVPARPRRSADQGSCRQDTVALPAYRWRAS